MSWWRVQKIEVEVRCCPVFGWEDKHNCLLKKHFYYWEETTLLQQLFHLFNLKVVGEVYLFQPNKDSNASKLFNYCTWCVQLRPVSNSHCQCAHFQTPFIILEVFNIVGFKMVLITPSVPTNCMEERFHQMLLKAANVDLNVSHRVIIICC